MTTEQMRELDAWIAKNVFGCIREHTKPYREGIPDTDVFDMWKQTDGTSFFCSAWKPTTDPAAAMEVLKKCVGKSGAIGASVDVQEYADHDGFQGFCVRSLMPKMQNSKSAVAPTLELAICLFAKKLFTK